jgi:RimJ/RimL family protein N-acetyltransferase
MTPLLFCLKLPRFIPGSGIILKRISAADGPFIKKVISAVRAPGQRGRARFTWLDAWWWAKKEYVCAYVIKAGGRPIGLVGLYNLDFRKSVDLTMVVAEEVDRGKGHGTEAFQLFLGYFSRARVAGVIQVIVSEEDGRTRAFWEGLGFTEKAILFSHDQYGDRRVLMHYTEGHAAE